ncbi:MAG: hypothetical protein K2X27_05550, partial [Candidatus Obscuribacterales bacterium]|nr:hypothetical protein [Candidatus Obscuribacterales bacterium]
MTQLQSSNRRGEIKPPVLIALGVAAVVVLGIIIGMVIHNHRKEAARTNTQAHLAACRALESQIQQQKGPLSSAGLNFQPYQGRFDAAVRDEKQAEAVLERDPQQAEQLADKAESGFKSVLSDTQLAVQVKGDQSGEKALSDAGEATRRWRQNQVNWGYPGAAGSSQERYRLDESGHNPDVHLGAAERLLSAVQPQLEAGKPQDAQRSIEEAKSEAAAAQRDIDSVIGAKKRVETEISAIQAKSEAADASLEAEVRKEYFAQHFV